MIASEEFEMLRLQGKNFRIPSDTVRYAIIVNYYGKNYDCP
jgi:hypothetical protein